MDNTKRRKPDSRRRYLRIAEQAIDRAISDRVTGEVVVTATMEQGGCRKVVAHVISTYDIEDNPT